MTIILLEEVIQNLYSILTCIGEFWNLTQSQRMILIKPSFYLSLNVDSWYAYLVHICKLFQMDINYIHIVYRFLSVMILYVLKEMFDK